MIDDTVATKPVAAIKSTIVDCNLFILFCLVVTQLLSMHGRIDTVYREEGSGVGGAGYENKKAKSLKTKCVNGGGLG